MSDDKPINRRRFFRAGLAELFKPLSKAARPLENLAQSLSKLDAPPPPPTAPSKPALSRRAGTAFGASAPHARSAAPFTDRPVLRPPGALDEPLFRATCSRSGHCVAACPVQCIRLDPTGREGAGAAYIDTAVAACVLCEDLACMSACPSGALVPTPREQIDMGKAFWNQQLCLRTQGQECTRCIDFCPVGESAIALAGGAIEVKPACTGCGLCQHQCPTDPKSIIVIPKSLRRN